MEEGCVYKIDHFELDAFFNSHFDELKNTQLFYDYVMGILDDLLLGSAELRSYIYLGNVIKRKNKESFAFCYVRYTDGFPVVERFYIEENPKRATEFFVKHENQQEAKLLRSSLLKKREI